MSSSVYYKFKSQRQESRVTFDGTGISVFDLKKEIILQNNLKASDIDLLVFDKDEQEYRDDSFIIPRSTSVIAKRMPASRPGKGRAAIYVANLGNSDSQSNPQSRAGSNAPPGSAPAAGTGRFGGMSRRFDGKDPKMSAYPPPPPPSQPTVQAVPPPSSTGGDEAASIAAMFAETSEQWEQTQAQMAQSRPVYTPRPFQNRTHQPTGQTAYNPPPRQTDTRPLPPGYICHRCNKKGHWIQDCPTNDDREYDNRPRVKRTTGIPRSFLKAVEVTNDGPMAKGVMVTPEGGFVVAEPDNAAWERQQKAKAKGLTEAEVKDRPPRDPSLACPQCEKLLRDAVKTPCCQKDYCEECIHTHLLEGSFECPNCKSRIPSLDKLRIDSEMRGKVREYVRNTVEESRKAAEQNAEAGPIADEPIPQVKAETEPKDKDDEVTDEQPGNENGGDQGFIDPSVVVTQLQAQLAQLMIMQSNPTLPVASRISINQQIQQLTMQLKQAEALRDMFQMGMNGMGGPMMGGMDMMGMGMQQPAMGMGMGNPGYMGQQQHQPWQKPQYNPGWHNTFSMHQPPNNQSAYERLPVNNRRNKRERPEDFGDGGPDSKRQYWE
ncbi:hypothetical protein FRB90_001515 [Tulasnella sp. 427]|nr:hypothetical protein FRB90_001515 [Tulasnella sp. 427]